MAAEETTRSFWTSLGGMLTGLATLIGTVTGVIVLMSTGGDSAQPGEVITIGRGDNATVASSTTRSAPTTTTTTLPFVFMAALRRASRGRRAPMHAATASPTTPPTRLTSAAKPRG